MLPKVSLNLTIAGVKMRNVIIGLATTAFALSAHAYVVEFTESKRKTP